MKKNLAFCILAFFATAFSQENYGQWSYYKAITLNTTNTAGGANVPTNRTFFPLLVRLSGPGYADVFTNAAANGSDIRFTKPDGITRLSHQIERWNSGAQTAEIWVNMDSVIGNSNSNVIRMYWGRAGAADSSSGPKTYPAGNGNVGVWHMGETSGNRINAVSPGTNDAVPVNYAGAFKAGYIAGADSLRGAAAGPTGDHLDVGDGYANFTGGFTYYAWVYPTSTASYSRFFEAANLTDRNDNISIYRANTSNNLIFEMSNGTTALGTATATGALALNIWQHIAAVYTPGTTNTLTLYKDGAQVATVNLSAALNNVTRTNVYLGKSNYAADAYYAGKYDEVNITNYATNADRVKLHYETQKSGATCVTLGATVAQVAPTNLRYSANPATYGLSTAITANNPTLTGVASGYSVTPALPAGLTLNPSTGVITGTPTATQAAANYTVTAQNAVGNTTVSLSITIIGPPSALSYAGGPFTFTRNVAITNLTPAVTGTVTGYSVNPALPAGLTLSTTTGVISGTPTAAQAGANYTVTASNIAGSTSTGVNITVLGPPSALSYAGAPFSFPEGVAITNRSPTVTGTVASYGVNPALPAGLTLNTTTGVISGTPTTAQAAANYTVTATNTAGNTTVSLSIAVYGPPTGLTYSQNPASYTRGVAITNNTPTITGTVTGYTVSPALPAGLTLSATTGVISGTPTAAQAATSYTVTATNAAGNTTVSLSITVFGPPTGLNYATNPAVYGLNVAITPNTPTVTGTVTNYVIAPTLPAGLSLSASTGVISGTPTVAATSANYVITASNPAGSALDTVNITVLAPNSNFSYAQNPAVYGVGVAIANNIPTVNSTGNTFSVSPALPAGLSLDPATGVISGTPTTPSPSTNYTVTATNVAGSITELVNFTVLAAPTGLTYSRNPAVYGVGTAITNNTPTVTGTVTRYLVSPALPAGLRLDTLTGVISGTPSAAAASASYTVTAQNVAGAVPVTLNITVLAVPTALSYAPNPASYAVGVAITPSNPTVTGIIANYSVAPTLPAGLVIDSVTGVLSGTPTAAATAQNHVITARNVAGAITFTLNIAVFSAPSGLTYLQTNVVYTLGVPIASLSPTVTGNITAYAVSPALPAGLSLNTTTGILSGTPTAAVAATNYTITASNAAGNTPFVLRITVLSVPTGFTYSQNPASYGVGTAITPNVPTVTGVVASYSVNPALPAGLVLDTLTGVISGTPSTETPARNYTVSATNASGSATLSLNLAVLSPPSNFAYAQNPALYGVGAAITNNVPTVTGAVTGYTVTPALPAGLSLNPTTGIISGTPTSESASGYLITARNAAGSVTVNLTITVLAPTSNFSYTDNPAVYTVGVAIANNNPSISGTPLGYSISPALPTGLSLSSSTGVISGTPTAQAPALNYTVTAQNVAGPATTTTLSIEVQSLSSNFSYAQNTVVYALNVAITPNAPTVTGTVQSYAVAPALPQGLSLNTTTGEITGTPTAASAAQNYVITGTNPSGSSGVTLNITVVAAPMGLTYAQNPVTYPLNATITSNAPTVTGLVTGYAIAPALPPGLSLNPGTGVISGTPTDTASAQNYVVTAQNVAGQTTFTLNLRVLAPPTALSYALNQVTYRVGNAIAQNAPTVTGAALTYTIDNPLPAGLVLNPATGVISGTPLSVTQATTYIITATNVSGSTQTTLTITVDIAIAIRPGNAHNAFNLKINGAHIAQIGLHAKARRAKVEIRTTLGKSLGVRLHNLGNGNVMEWGSESSLPNGLLLIKISLLDENHRTLSATLLKVPHFR